MKEAVQIALCRLPRAQVRELHNAKFNTAGTEALKNGPLYYLSV